MKPEKQLLIGSILFIITMLGIAYVGPEVITRKAFEVIFFPLK
jgi:hypothetical protein